MVSTLPRHEMPETSSEYDSALVELKSAIECFEDTGQKSGSDDDIYSDSLDCEAVAPGGDVHNAVCAVESCCPNGKLPTPARASWIELTWVCQNEPDTYKCLIVALRAAGELLEWVEFELAPRVDESPTEEWPEPSPDFSSITWFDGETYTFNTRQAIVLKILWTVKPHRVREDHIIVQAEEEGVEIARVVDVFRPGHKRHPAFGVVVVKGEKNTYGIAEPPKK